MLTVTWDAPATDSASTYTVKIYKDADAFSSVAQSWTSLAWNNDPALPAGQGQLVYQSSSYTFTTPTLSLDPGALPMAACLVQTIETWSAAHNAI